MFYRETRWRELLGSRTILIAGYGREGRSSERFLSQLLPAEQYGVADGNEAILAAAPHYDLILKSPGIPTMIFEGICDMEKISSQTDLFLQVYGDNTIGISGTKGKSTTTELIYSILSQHVPVGVGGEYSEVVKAGNMGIPLFDIIPQLDEHTLVVAELSCHQLENIHRAPHTALLLNLFQEHLDHYHDYEGYKHAKLNIALRQAKDDTFIYCTDNDDLREAVERHAHAIVSHVEGYDSANPFRCTASPSLIGSHNRSNITAAAAVVRHYGVTDEAIAESVATFKGLKYRLQHVGQYDGIDFYDDSISTIPAATMAAVEALENVDTLILGGYDRGIDYGDFARFLAHSAVRNLVFVGRAGDRMLSLYRSIVAAGDDERKILSSDDYGVIVPWCFRNTAVGRICLLSPAASSYDSFKNFEHRGRCFDTLVHDVALRHDLHRHAGLSGHEDYAHDVIVAALRAMHPTALHEHVGGNGVVAFWGDKDKPCVAFRADTDALPIGEACGVGYSSQTAGVSHKCGHDGHTATLLHFASMVETEGLQQVMLIFQPEEETGLGAEKIIDSGILDRYKISHIFGMHNLPGYKLGRLVMVRGTFAAASSGVAYHLQGRQTHASTPELGINPGLAVAQIVERMQNLNTGQQVPLATFRQTTLIGIRLGEEAFGTSAGDADVMFTLRAYTNDGMRSLMAEADAIVNDACGKFSSGPDALVMSSTQREPFNATENDNATVERLEEMAQAAAVDYEMRGEPFRWSEDFANYLMRYPGAMFGIGAGESHSELHHPLYDFPDEIIHRAALLYCKILCTFAK